MDCKSKDDILKRLEAIEERNNKVSLNKSWETSLARILIITSMTYVVASAFLFFIGSQNPFVASIIPAVGFYFSTRSLSIFRKIWEKL